MSDGVVALLLFSIPPVARELSGRFLFAGFEPGRIPLDAGKGSLCVCDACRAALDIVAVNRRGGASEGNGVARMRTYQGRRDRDRDRALIIRGLLVKVELRI